MNKQIWLYDLKKKSELDTRATELSKESMLFSNKSHYWTHEGLPYVRALACVQIVLLRSEKAGKIYLEAKGAWGKPDCLLAMDDFKLYWLDAHYHTQVINRMKRIYDQTKEISLPEICFDSEKYNDSKDFQYLTDKIGEFIKIGFNRESEQAENIYKVMASTDPRWLFLAATTYTLADFCRFKLSEWNEYKKVRIGNKSYDFESIMNDHNDRLHRKYVAAYKRFKHVLRSDKKLLKDADIWYKCRVEPGTIEAYISDEAGKIDQMGKLASIEADKLYKHLNRDRIEKDIAPYDLATGYPRKWRE